MTESFPVDGVEWKQAITLLNGNKYAPRRRWGAAYCTVQERIFICGGCSRRDGVYQYLRDAWMLFRGTKPMELMWEQIPDAPDEFEGRFQHSATLVGDSIWIIGGQATCRVFDDIFTYNIRSRKWKQHFVRNPFAVCRSGHAAVVSPTEPEKILLYGGCGLEQAEKEKTPDLVVLDTKTLIVVPVSSTGDPRISRINSIPIHVSTSRIYFLGGCDSTQAPIKGGAYFDTEKRVWKESFINSRELEGLMGGKAVVYQKRIYVYGGKPADKQDFYSNELLEINLAEEQKDIKVYKLQCKELNGRANHVLFILGDYLYTLQGIEANDGQHSPVFYTDLKALNTQLRQKERLQHQREVCNARAGPSQLPQQNLQNLLVQRQSNGKYFLNIALEDLGIVKKEEYEELKRELEKSKANNKTQSEELIKRQTRISNLQNELSRSSKDSETKFKSDLIKKDKEIKDLKEEMNHMRSFLDSIGDQLTTYKRASASERPAGPEPKRQSEVSNLAFRQK